MQSLQFRIPPERHAKNSHEDPQKVGNCRIDPFILRSLEQIIFNSFFNKWIKVCKQQKWLVVTQLFIRVFQLMPGQFEEKKVKYSAIKTVDSVQAEHLHKNFAISISKTRVYSNSPKVLNSVENSESFPV